MDNRATPTLYRPQAPPQSCHGQIQKVLICLQVDSVSLNFQGKEANLPLNILDFGNILYQQRLEPFLDMLQIRGHFMIWGIHNHSIRVIIGCWMLFSGLQLQFFGCLALVFILSQSVEKKLYPVFEKLGMGWESTFGCKLESPNCKYICFRIRISCKYE